MQFSEKVLNGKWTLGKVRGEAFEAACGRASQEVVGSASEDAVDLIAALPPFPGGDRISSEEQAETELGFRSDVS